ncbi:hypothetical protein CEXT_762321 [Caerostris extrusa]|uniref:Uncharacterized protein n=1 Tax=Caerostris extrusa TaxID=172846 RepID=A0AAV4YBU9_CAEEX|nr:hypothetical protein CEXT_762321 [Caerostris extrusa]
MLLHLTEKAMPKPKKKIRQRKPLPERRNIPFGYEAMRNPSHAFLSAPSQSTPFMQTGDKYGRRNLDGKRTVEICFSHSCGLCVCKYIAKPAPKPHRLHSPLKPLSKGPVVRICENRRVPLFFSSAERRYLNRLARAEFSPSVFCSIVLQIHFTTKLNSPSC